MIGKELYEMLLELCGDNVYGIDKSYCDTSDCSNPRCGDLSYKDVVEMYLSQIKFDYVFHLVGIKGNPKMTKERPVDFIGPMLQFDTNMILAAQKYGVKRFLYTSSIAVEHPETDWFPAWAKRTGEELIKAMRVQYPKGTKYCIVRPSNAYGRFDNFNNPNAMVVTSLISKGIKDKKLILDKCGVEQERDLINAKDVALGMIKAIEDMPIEPVNLSSGRLVRINDLAKLIARELNIKIEYKDLGMTLGPKKKILRHPYIKPTISLEDGIKEVIYAIKK